MSTKPWDSLREPAKIGIGEWHTCGGCEINLTELHPNAARISIGEKRNHRWLQKESLIQLGDFCHAVAAQLESTTF